MPFLSAASLSLAVFRGARSRSSPVGAGFGAWVRGARPRTLPAAVSPVLVGTAVASVSGGVIWWRAGACLVVAGALQVATNYANDYSDGVRGADAERVGPQRLVASGAARPKAVLAAAGVSFAVAGIAGLALAAAVGPQLIVLGAACIAAGWLYTGGPRPYGYAGWGEVFVFVFFGLVAVIGTAYVQTLKLTALAVAAAVPVGLLAVGLLVANNLRDIEGDALAGKKTLAVRMGPRATRVSYAFVVLAPFALVGPVAWVRPWAAVALIALPLAVSLVLKVLRGVSGLGLGGVLGGGGVLALVFAVLLAVGIAV